MAKSKKLVSGKVQFTANTFYDFHHRNNKGIAVTLQDMKRIISIFLAVLILAQSVRGYLTYVSLKLNQAEIAAKFCTSQDIPLCFGSCYIEQQLKQLEAENQKVPLKAATLKVEIWLINQIVPAITTSPSFAFLPISTIKFPLHAKRLVNAYLDTVFQPPRYSIS